jgi:hypothetical protein
MLSKYKNKCREIQESKLIYRFVCIFELLYFKCKAHTFYLGRPSYPGKVFDMPGKASYSAASCKQSPGITIRF